ncbi:hypothetical protein [Methylomonas methanica]|uniref:Uncharacterized protein n=1 Tax=Methylomonas methanica (strain DSM 25384 / MC09) TaxID=857087 RepID=G0A3Y3_METMM|nr:hypothetical protein [Methylomonas methanica]AEG02755.1 hypothetical protein Metme_4408 [Methylomonas methanica MC09]
MRTVLLLVSCFFLSSTVQASLESDSNAMSCLYDTVSCSNVISLRRETLQENAPLPLQLTDILKLSDFKTYLVQPTVQFTQPNGGSPIALSAVPRTLSAGTVTLLNPNRELIWNNAGSGGNVSLNTGQLGGRISVPDRSSLISPKASLTPSYGEITILSPGASISALRGDSVSLQAISTRFTQSPAEISMLSYGGAISIASGSISSLNIASTPRSNIFSSNQALNVPLPASLNILLSGLAFMLFSSRRSTMHKAAY